MMTATTSRMMNEAAREVEGEKPTEPKEDKNDIAMIANMRLIRHSASAWLLTRREGA